MKIVLFVEGPTEEKALPEFLGRWLGSHFPSHRIGLKTVRFKGWSEYTKDIAQKVDRHLSGKAGVDVLGAIGLLDLYGPTIYPPQKTTADERYAWGKEYFERTVNHARFRQHFATHETEAWLRSDPSIFPKQIGSALPGKVANPESVNFNEPPAKLLDRLHQEKLRRNYRKVIDGANLFAKLEPTLARSKCPCLARLMDDLLLFAASAPT